MFIGHGIGVASGNGKYQISNDKWKMELLAISRSTDRTLREGYDAVS